MANQTGGYYRNAKSIDDVNRFLGLISDRLDALEGGRGTVVFQSDLDLGGNKATNCGSPADGSDAVTLTYGNAHYGPAAIASAFSVGGTNPLNLVSLPGVASEPQSGKITRLLLSRRPVRGAADGELFEGTDNAGVVYRWNEATQVWDVISATGTAIPETGSGHLLRTDGVETLSGIRAVSAAWTWSANLIVTSAAAFGSGTSSPAAPVHVVKTGTGIQTAMILANETAVTTASVGAQILFKGHTASGRSQGTIAVSTGPAGSGDDCFMAFSVRNASNTVTEYARIMYDGKVGIGTTAPSTLLHVGLAGTTLGTIGVAGNTSGLVTIQPAAAAGTWTFTLPTSGGTNKYALTTDGSGTSAWSQVDLTAAVTGTLPVANGGTGRASLTNHGVLVGATTSAITQLAVGSNGQLLVGSTGADPVFATLGTGTGISITAGAGSLTVNNTGVTSIVAGVRVTISGSTGAVTVNAPEAGTPTDVSGSRAIGTNYQNTSGYKKRVCVTIRSAVATATGILLYCDSSSTPTTLIARDSKGAFVGLDVFTNAYIEVPNGYYYRADADASSTLYLWSETDE